MTDEASDQVNYLERTFESAQGKVVCSFRRPRPDGEDYRCDYEIEWPDRRRAFHAMGVDGVQALLLAMEVAHARLVSSPEGEAGGLTWLGQKELGLPISSSLRDLGED